MKAMAEASVVNGGDRPGESPRRLVVVGQGYVGLPLAMRAVDAGWSVVGFEVDDDRAKRLAAGESFAEDVPSRAVAAALASGRYQVSTDAGAMAGFGVAVIAVPTPLRSGQPDLSHVEQAAQTVARHVSRGSTVIVESTSYPGTTEGLVARILKDGSGLVAGADFHLGYSPERIDPGNAVWGLVNTPKIVSGVNPASLAAVESFYSQIVTTTVPVSGCREAELAKLLENTFRHVNIALVNELAIFAADLGIDVWEAIRAAATKPFGFMSFTPGPGVGGHCTPVDPSYLSWLVTSNLGRSFRFVELANDVNNGMPDYVAQRVMIGLNRLGKPLNGSRVLLLGLAYKKNTGDARSSPAVALAARLRRYGADVRGADPHVAESPPLEGIPRVELTIREVAQADAVILLADHDAFDLDMVTASARYIFDPRHRLRGANVEHL
jgi:UDP-N-acetyl-D-glucosamine dehydrogenase